MHMSEQTNYDEKTVRECAKDICVILNSAHTKSEYSSLYKKFSLSKFMEVSKIAPSNQNQNEASRSS
jgi:hypothetical protein